MARKAARDRKDARHSARSPILAAALLGLTILAYLPALRSGFIWDDDAYVTHNSVLTEAGGLLDIWFKPRATIQYYPLVFTTFWIEHKLWGFSPTGYHFTNVLLHALAAVLFWRLLRKLDVPGAGLAAAIFAVHPVCVESVAWVTERKNVLSIVFYLLAATSYIHFAGLSPPRSDRRDWRAYFIAFGLFACALLSKTAVCALPVGLLLVIWWKRGALRSADILPMIPFFIMAGGLAYLTAHLEKKHVGSDELEWTLTYAERIVLAGRSLVFYAGKIAWPANLAFIYHRPPVDAASAGQWAYPIGVAGGMLGLWLARGWIGRGPLAAVLCFAVTLAPALGFILFFFMTYSFVADHFQYHAMLGPIALAAAAVSRAPMPSRRFLPGAAAMIVAVLAVMTFRRCLVFENSETLWNDVLAKSPSARRMAHDNLAVYYCGIGRLDDGVRHYRETLAIQPDQPEALSNLGVALSQLGKIDEGIAALREAARLNPNHPQAHANLGLLLSMQGKRDEAYRHYVEAIRLNPEMAEAHFNLARLLVSAGRIPEAIQHYEQVLRLNPADAEARQELDLIKSGPAPSSR